MDRILRNKLHTVNVSHLTVKVQMLDSSQLLMLEKSCRNGWVTLDSFADRPCLSKKETG